DVGSRSQRRDAVVGVDDRQDHASDAWKADMRARRSFDVDPHPWVLSWAGRHMDRERRDPGLLARPTFHDPCTDGAATILGGQFVEITGDAGGDLTALVPGEVVCLVSLRDEPRVQLLQGDRLEVASPPRDLEER